jgi:hypothetical protein
MQADTQFSFYLQYDSCCGLPFDLEAHVQLHYLVGLNTLTVLMNLHCVIKFGIKALYIYTSPESFKI